PFNPTTKIKFSIPSQDYVQLDVFNIQGELVNKLFKKNLTSGSYEVEWNGKNNLDEKIVSGIYVVRLTVGNKVFSNKVLLTK
ncbi:MAG: T9SS type A sorting domain-containing protein, partial [Melioribacteraceae bacterium]|nr:T9SS type A sorting domain-containing protein [Melioribacteraceae bacterium]